MGYWEKPGMSDEWYTPPSLFKAMSVRFDLDVAAPPSGVGCYTPADKFISQDSLSRTWEGFIWMNPPFGGRNGIAPWLDKFCEHRNGIALVPDRTSAPWFRDAWSKVDYVVFTKKIKFLRPDGTFGKSPSNGTCLMFIGNTAYQAASKLIVDGYGIGAQPTKIVRIDSGIF